MACRPVTNFVSAHDVDMNRSVDMFYNENGEDITSTDTIWLAIGVLFTATCIIIIIVMFFYKGTSMCGMRSGWLAPIYPEDSVAGK